MSTFFFFYKFHLKYLPTSRYITWTSRHEYAMFFILRHGMASFQGEKKFTITKFLTQMSVVSSTVFQKEREKNERKKKHGKIYQTCHTLRLIKVHKENFYRFYKSLLIIIIIFCPIRLGINTRLLPRIIYKVITNYICKMRHEWRRKKKKNTQKINNYKTDTRKVTIFFYTYTLHMG